MPDNADDNLPRLLIREVQDSEIAYTNTPAVAVPKFLQPHGNEFSSNVSSILAIRV